VRAVWHETVSAARPDDAHRGRLARWRDRLVCRVAESIAEQRALWALRKAAAGTADYPSDLETGDARAILRRTLAHARRHHLRWLLVDGALSAASVLLVVLPGPNVVAYYFLFRLVGHYLSWRGARQALDRTAWTFRPEPALAELGALAALPRDSRAAQLQAIANRLDLPRLPAFFDRAAVPVA